MQNSEDKVFVKVTEKLNIVSILKALLRWCIEILAFNILFCECIQNGWLDLNWIVSQKESISCSEFWRLYQYFIMLCLPFLVAYYVPSNRFMERTYKFKTAGQVSGAAFKKEPEQK